MPHWNRPVEANNPARSAARRIVLPAGRAHSGGAGSDGFEFCSRNRRLCAHLGSLIVPFHLCAEHLLKHLAIALSFDGFLCRAFGEPAMHFRINLPMWRLRPQGSRRPYEPAKRFELVEDVFDFLPLEAASSARAGIGDPAADSDFPSGDSDYTPYRASMLDCRSRLSSAPVAPE